MKDSIPLYAVSTAHCHASIGRQVAECQAAGLQCTGSPKGSAGHPTAYCPPRNEQQVPKHWLQACGAAAKTRAGARRQALRLHRDGRRAARAACGAGRAVAPEALVLRLEAAREGAPVAERRAQYARPEPGPKGG